MKVVIEGDVVAVSRGVTAKEKIYHDVTMLQRAKDGDSRGEPELVKVRCWNGQVEKLQVGKPGRIEAVVRLLKGVDATGRPYPPRITVDAF